MTPDEAATVLGVPAGSTAAEIESAYVRMARQTHPDRLVGADPEQLAAASAAFVRVSDARLVLLQVRSRVLAAASVPPPSPWPLRVWTALLLPGAVITLAGAGIPYPFALAALPLVIAVVALAVVGRRWMFSLTVVLGLAYATITVVNATFGGLLALGLLQVPVMAVLILRTPRRTGATAGRAPSPS